MTNRLLTIALILAALAPITAVAQGPSGPVVPPPTAEELVRKMDEVLTFKTRIAVATMTVTRDGKSDARTLRMQSRGWDDSYSEFLAPARDKGIKYLKVDKNLYMFLPGTEKVVKVSGHLLRQSLMDSDFSYEDMLESRALLQDYDAKLLGSETVDGTDCWVLDLTAKQPGQTYARRKTFIAKATFIPLRVERYAASGLLLKVMSQSEIKTSGAKLYAARMRMEDKSRAGSVTELLISDPQFDIEVPAETFSRRRLMKGD